MATATKKETAVKKEAAVTAKPKAVKKPKVEAQSTENRNVRNVQIHLTKEKNVSTEAKVHKMSAPVKNDALVLHKVTTIQKAKNWINRIMGRNK